MHHTRLPSKSVVCACARATSIDKRHTQEAGSARRISENKAEFPESATIREPLPFQEEDAGERVMADGEDPGKGRAPIRHISSLNPFEIKIGKR